MKKMLMILVALSGIVTACYSQTTGYRAGEQVTADGITFKVEGEFDAVLRMQNIQNRWTDSVRVYYRDGRPLEPENYDLVSATALPGSLNRALTATFTESEFEQLQSQTDESLILYVTISPAEGRVCEVGFIMDQEAMQLIPPAKFALLEKNLKQYVTYEVNALGKQLQYLGGPVFVNFARLHLDYTDAGNSGGVDIGDSLEGTLIDPNRPGFGDSGGTTQDD